MDQTPLPLPALPALPALEAVLPAREDKRATSNRPPSRQLRDSVPPTHREVGTMRPPPEPPPARPQPDAAFELAARKHRPRRARAVEAEADLWAALDSGPPSIPSAAAVADAPPVAHESRPTTPSGIAIGQVLAERYYVESVLGEGGMGIVYHCRDSYTGDDVALKRVIIPDGPLANEYVMWFYKESRALATLDH
ncbi:MAG TPA: hypothetical protein VIV60_32575, partial [Polyangiaceae bacterium]